MTVSNKRRLPRHVDGRFKILNMFWKVFFLRFLPIAVVVVSIVFAHFSPVSMVVGVLCIGLLVMGFSEIGNKETGFSYLRDVFLYWKQGRIYFERSTQNVPVSKRCIRNQISKRS